MEKICFCWGENFFEAFKKYKTDYVTLSAPVKTSGDDDDSFVVFDSQDTLTIETQSVNLKPVSFLFWLKSKKNSFFFQWSRPQQIFWLKALTSGTKWYYLIRKFLRSKWDSAFIN